jgi:O-antigen chain-terminating methyltransferase
MDMDGFYQAFETQFRGSREDIKRRQSIYLPLVDYSSPSAASPALDIGCGRGEWLELLRDHGVRTRGVDLNAEFVKSGVDAGFDLVGGDGVSFLRDQPTLSYSLITAFHVVEHLRFDVLMELITHAYKALKPGGVCLFETPNPMNVRVGINNFYLDPTHVRPLPSELLKFTMEYVGFSHANVLYVNGGLSNDADLFSTPDYAVVAFKSPDSDVAPVLELVDARIRGNRRAPLISDPSIDSIKLVSTVLDAQARVHQAELLAQSAEQRASQHEERARLAHSLAQQADSRAEAAESRAVAAESRAVAAESRAVAAESRAEAAERTTEQHHEAAQLANSLAENAELKAKEVEQSADFQAQLVRERDNQITALEARTIDLSDRLKGVEKALESVYGSNSWRITAPLRALSSAIKFGRRN